LKFRQAVADVYSGGILICMEKYKVLDELHMNSWRFSMKRLFVAMALATLISMPSAAMNLNLAETQFAFVAQSDEKALTLVDDAPVCDSARIAQQEVLIKQDEYKKSLMRAGVYLCAFAGASYLGYKFFKSVQTVVPNFKSKILSPEEIFATKLLIEKEKASSFLSGRWFKNLFIGARDMAFQSAVLGGFYGAGTYLKHQLFYGKRIDEFLVRSTNLVHARAEIEGCAAMLEGSNEGNCYHPIQTLLKDRTLLLCHSVERVVAYMHSVRDGVEIGSKDAFVVAEQFLITRTDAALASLWHYATNTEKKPAELARGIALTLHIFTQDFAQAVERFDTAYYLATQAA
jgi:hypothetical protein